MPNNEMQDFFDRRISANEREIKVLTTSIHKIELSLASIASDAKAWTHQLNELIEENKQLRKTKESRRWEVVSSIFDNLFKIAISVIALYLGLLK